MHSSDLTPLLWLAAFGLACAVHLSFHPQTFAFREALRWMRQNPAPLLIFAASVMVVSAFQTWPNNGSNVLSTVHAHSPWSEVWPQSFASAVRRFALVFHQAVMPLPLWPGHVAGAILQALISATSQVWLCCYLVVSLRTMISHERRAILQTTAHWQGILWLTLCHLPWWYFQGNQTTFGNVMNYGVLPEFLLFLAPVPLSMAATSAGFFRAGGIALKWWKNAWLPFLGFALTALPLLALQEYSLMLAKDLLQGPWAPLQLVLESLVVATVHLWLFASGALLLLRGGYVQRDSFSQK